MIEKSTIILRNIEVNICWHCARLRINTEDSPFGWGTYTLMGMTYYYKQINKNPIHLYNYSFL